MACDVNWLKIQSLLKQKNQIGLKRNRVEDGSADIMTSLSKKTRKVGSLNDDLGSMPRYKQSDHLSEATSTGRNSSTSFFKRLGIKPEEKQIYAKTDWDEINFDVLPAPKTLKRDKNFEKSLINEHEHLSENQLLNTECAILSRVKTNHGVANKNKTSGQTINNDNSVVASSEKPRSEKASNDASEKRWGFQKTSSSGKSKELRLQLPTNMKEPTKFIGLDCEMVGALKAGSFNLLARVSIVNSHGHVLLDKYVRPSVDVTDYRTEFSGVTAEQLLERGQPLRQVQAEVATLLKGRVVVGHDLHQDFKVLFLQHPKKDMRDTSLYPPFRKFAAGSGQRSKTPALRVLSEKLLGIQIQAGEHDSVQDAQVAMKLFMTHRRDWEQWLAKRLAKLKTKSNHSIQSNNDESNETEVVTSTEESNQLALKEKAKRMKRQRDKRHNRKKIKQKQCQA